MRSTAVRQGRREGTARLKMRCSCIRPGKLDFSSRLIALDPLAHKRQAVATDASLTHWGAVSTHGPTLTADSEMAERQNAYSYEELLACGRGELFGPGNAQLPLPPMLMFDRISEISETGGEHGKGLVRAELDVKPDLWFFGCHFKNDPVMPGCLGLDALWQMVGF